MTKGRHNLKMGVSLEFNHKTEPGSADYMGNYNFGNDANNPLNTGNGYANMLLGMFSTYTELTARVDKAVRHWQNDFYFQDNWRATPRLTLDYGVRLQHSGSDFEVNNNHTGFFIDQWNASQAARVYRLVCTTGVPGDQRARRRISGRSIRRIPACSSRPRSTATSCRARQPDQRRLDRRHPGRESRNVFQVPVSRRGAARRHGLERDRRRQDGDPRVGGNLLQLPAIDRHRRLPLRRRLPGLVQQPDPLGDVRRHRGVRQRNEHVQLVQSPVNVNVGGFDQPLAKSYNVNVAFQRDIGFNTVAEIAYVGNFQYEAGRTVDVNRLPLYVYGNSANLVNNAPLNANSLRQVYGTFPAWGRSPSSCRSCMPCRSTTTPCS